MEVITKANMEYLSRENTNHKNNKDSIGKILNRPTNLLLKNLNSFEVNNVETTTSTSNACPDNYVQRHDIAFKNLSYSVKAGFWSKDKKIILREINGNFKSGELSAIMGPSGAGKSSLLNIIAGYTTHNITGVITINDELRELKKFLPQSAYIKQDTDLQPFLTVGESMHFSANLKLGKILSQIQKKERIKNVLEAIGLYDARRTRTGKLSGGQKKRLSIALELMSNPPVLILDEPTSGLDSSTSTQCISLLKKLAMEGRTIICTIHQPSALVFGMFDHLFAIAEGRCIFSGGTENVIPFLQELNLKCPESYNPSDYLLEISTNDYGYENQRLVDQIQNGLCENYRKKNQSKNQIEIMGKVDRMMESGLITPVNAPFISMLSNSSLAPITEVSSIWGSHASGTDTRKKPSIQIDHSLLCKINNRYPASFCRQLSILLMRTFLILWRNKSLTTMRILIHAAMGLFVGLLYYGIGNDASNVFNNFKYIFFSIMFIMYSAFSSIILNFPLEFPIVSREHFNRWYSLRAYYVALTLADVPIQLICTSIFIGISYLLTSQPLEILRLILFFTMVVMSALVAQSIGLAVGAFLSVKNGAILGPFFICPFLIFSGFFIQMQDVHDAMHWLFHISFLKYTLEGATIAIFGFARPKMDCKEMYCHFIRPKKFLQAVGLENGNYEFSILALIIIFLSLRILSFYIMSFRLRLFR